VCLDLHVLIELDFGYQSKNEELGIATRLVRAVLKRVESEAANGSPEFEVLGRDKTAGEDK